MKVTVGRTYRFRATHSLPDFPEPWCFPHQHDYTVEVEAEGGTPTDDLDQGWADAMPILGDFYDIEPSTVENIAAQVLKRIPEATAVTVWEDKQRWGRAER